MWTDTVGGPIVVARKSFGNVAVVAEVVFFPYLAHNEKEETGTTSVLPFQTNLLRFLPAHEEEKRRYKERLTE